ncbi:MAG: transcriptional coactivator p15/PC4 family protein [Bradyrhizobium sp.]|uniref:transcriptional coactivator p15/PC4 family protein n=1 Tax=Bradyrhizobium sp. TaxID=376 RepID=UPI0027310BFA|nr:transcriptional coactivator p15/PC4 family protein [Bradyrhizobium sp.]MDP1868448.1 transcriptional coactivator p15/PC4 family protein [Bradyrhizobium sp.]
MTDYPVVIAEWERNALEVVRVSLDCYRGHYTIDIRVWWFAGKDLKPGKTGITLGVRNLEQLAKAINDARARAAEIGLVDRG